MGQGPEDDAKWGTSDSRAATSVVWCHICKKKIGVHHCAEPGCPWCSQCGAKLQDRKKS